MRRLFVLATVLALLARFAEGATCNPEIFITAPTYADPGAAKVVIADFNNDGLLDIATSTGYPSPNAVSVLLNAGDGTFGTPIVTAISNTPNALAATDLRSNGTTDLVVTEYDGIQVLLGHGDGTFDPPVSYPSGTYDSIAMTVGKFDANNSPDVVISTNYLHDLVFFPGNGDGTFGTPLVTAGSDASGLVSGDFDGDGKLDLVGSNGNLGTISFFAGLGDGMFGPRSDFIAGQGLGGATAGDFDGDGKLDVAVTSGNLVSVLIGNGNGTFQAALQYSSGIYAGLIATADFDQNGTLDLVVGGPGTYSGQSESISVLNGNGDGTFGAATPYLVQAAASGIAVGDLNGDSFPDVASANAAVSVSLNAGNGSLLAVPESAPLAGPNTSNQPAIAQGDWNHDGSDDFAWVTGNQITVIESVAGGRLRQTETLIIGGSNPQPYAVGDGDFDGDGNLDLVVSEYSDILIFAGNGDGTFAAPQGVFSSYNLGFLTVADFNGDGKPDVAFTQGCCGSQFLVVLLGNGDGTFQSPVQTPVGFDSTSFLPADFNGDGRADLAVTSQNGVFVFVSNGDGTFQPPAAVVSNPNCCFTFWIATGDFGSGALDLLIADGSTHVSLYSGNGDGTFQPPVSFGLASAGAQVTTGDYDGDGNQDFAVVSGNQTILVFLGLGNSRFLSPAAFPSASNVSLLRSGDFLGNGLPDIAGIASDSATMLVNSRLGAAVPPAVSVLIGSPIALTARASGFGPVTYQWRKNGTPLSDGGAVSGATTAMLTIDPAAFTDAGSYDVVVTDSCTSTASNTAVVSVEFADVPVSNIFHADIITIATAGVTAGCGGADYCPTALVTRAQMAVFLLKSEHGSAYAPPGCGGIFADVPCPSTYADWIEQLSNEGVTAGCGGGDYCPDASVTRAQMAVFLLKTSQGSAYVPPPATAIFGDVPVTAFAADFIDDLYNRGIAAGCSASPLLYCPDSPVNRGQMAAFLVNTFF
jgi:hypothetical protein